MKITVASDRQQCGAAAAAFGAAKLREALAQRSSVNIIVATGASQFELLAELVREPDIAWERITAFHLDEYVGVPISHRASFRAYLWERFHRLLPRPLRSFHYIAGDGDPTRECERLGTLIAQHPIDVCFAGIGENAHLAFNDPPADFSTERPYVVVELDEACRQQQLGEGWFDSFEAVPRQAISMSIRQLMKSRTLVVTAPDARKARAVRDSLEGPVTNSVPSSILQQHADCAVFLDPASAASLSRQG